MNANMENRNQALTCDLTAIPLASRKEHVIAAPQLFQTVQEVQELSNGYAFRFLNEPGKFAAIAKYIENERLCCPFFNFELEVQSSAGVLWLRLTGGEGVKELLRSGLVKSYQDENGLKEAIQV